MLSTKAPSYWKENIVLAPYSTYKIGGKARLFTTAQNQEQLKEALLYCQKHQIPYYILGNGSNTLFEDRGFDGAVILNKLDFLEREGSTVYAGSGISFPKLGVQTARAGLSGLEYAAGVPGTLGGALYMNAGANGQEIKDLVEEVEFMDLKGGVHLLTKDQLLFKYRWSCFHLAKGVILAAKLKLTESNCARENQKAHLLKRQETQPLKEHSCGCIFRNTEEVSAGAIIDQLGLKGTQIGGAQISERHANFIVNKGDAKSQDVLDLVTLIETKVFEKKGLKLQREIRLVPFKGNL